MGEPRLRLIAGVDLTMARAEADWFNDHAATARRFAGPLCAILFVALATAARNWLGGTFPSLTVFSLYYPAILGAALVGGWATAAFALLLSFGVTWFMLRLVWEHGPPAAVAMNLLLFMFAGSFIAATGARLRALLQRRAVDIERLADREARYRALFEGVSEGFALVQGIWGPDGRLLDLEIVDANPASLAMFDVSGPVIGRRQSEFVSMPPDLLAAAERAFRGERVRVEILGPLTRHWFDVRMGQAGDNRLAEIAVDITERKLAESRQSEMFEELNHRVKNNLAAVSSMLGIQARLADEPHVREQLQKAVDRIHAIGDVHASLYRRGGADEVDLADYLRQLCGRLSSTLMDGERVRVELAAEHAMVPLDDAVALGLIVNELITNAAKHAYPPPAGGVISVALKAAPEGLELSVSDDGVGLAGAAEGSGIGMRLVRSLVQQCRGELEVRSDQGARFTIHIRDPDQGQPDEARSQIL
jgi:two-component sensor histidine kinase/PAS domain-containing protein